jgi:ribonuclease HII
MTVTRGDRRSLSIAAASIVAKVTRDRLMAGYHRLYPAYGFDRHKGYPTRAHREAVRAFGCSPIHRRSFKGVPGR